MALIERLWIGVLCSALCLSVPVLAQEQRSSPDLLNAERAFQIAREAVQAGDIQTAIVALERILVISPDLANIQFELALLYKRVGALTRAEYLFSESLKSEEMPENVRLRAQSELRELAGVPSSGDVVYQVGLRSVYESNPGSVSERLKFLDFVSQEYRQEDNQVSAESDGSFQFNAGVSYIRRFGRSADDSWNAGLSFNTTKYLEQSEFDDSSLSLRGGSSFVVNSGSSRYQDRMSPYVSYSVGFDGSEIENSRTTLGVGFSKSARDWSSGVSLQVDATRYEDNRRASLSDSAGGRAGLNFRFRAGEGSDTTIGVSSSYTASNAAIGVDSYNGVDIRISATHPVRGIAFAPRSTITAFIGTGKRSYDAINMLISNDQAREDNRRLAGIVLSVPFSNGLGLSAGVQVLDNRSSLSNFRYRSTTASLGMNWRF